MNRPVDVLVVGGVATAGLVFFGKDLLHAWRSRSWPTVPGRVVDSGIETSTTSADDLSVTRKVRVRYAYLVEGKEYESERVSFFGNSSGHKYADLAAAQLARFPKGAPFMVRYDPANPSNAVLDAGADSAAPKWYYFAVSLFGFGVLMSLFMAVRLAIGR